MTDEQLRGALGIGQFTETEEERQTRMMRLAAEQARGMQNMGALSGGAIGQAAASMNAMQSHLESPATQVRMLQDLTRELYELRTEVAAFQSRAFAALATVLGIVVLVILGGR